MDKITKKEFKSLIPISKQLGNTLLNCLKCKYPDKQFVVFVSIHLRDSMIVRFHQKWEGEEPYYRPSDFNGPNERVFSFE